MSDPVNTVPNVFEITFGGRSPAGKKWTIRKATHTVISDTSE